MNDEQILGIFENAYKAHEGRIYGRQWSLDVGRALLAASASAEPIYQVRKLGQLKWQDMQAISMSMYAGNDDYQTRTVYAAPRPIEAPNNSQAVALSERVTQLQDALETALEFIADATITEGQWHWVEEARAALSAPASMSAEPDGYAFRSDGKLWVTQSLAVAERWKAQGFEIVPVSSMTPENRPAIEASEHKPGCDALGGYGHGVGPCSCGAENRPAQDDVREDLESLLDDVTAIDTWYRGSPSYEHDAGWFKDRVVRLIEERIAAIASQSEKESR